MNKFVWFFVGLIVTWAVYQCSLQAQTVPLVPVQPDNYLFQQQVLDQMQDANVYRWYEYRSREYMMNKAWKDSPNYSNPWEFKSGDLGNSILLENDDDDDE